MNTIPKARYRAYLKLLWQAVENIVGSQNKECCGFGVYNGYCDPPECCGNPITDADRIEKEFLKLLIENGLVRDGEATCQIDLITKQCSTANSKGIIQKE